jgi:2'-5' RNA ligase
MTRLFLAVTPPEAVRESLESLLGPRRDASTDVRWLPPENWHLTLAFLYEVDDARADNLGDLLAGVAARTAPFAVTVEGGGCFPHADAARVLWLGVAAGADEIGVLARRCRTAAARAGIDVEGGRYRPHLTLGRHSRGAKVRGWLGVLDSFPALAWQVDHFALYSSELNRGGSRYRELQRFELAGS